MKMNYIPELNNLVRSIVIKSSHQSSMINKRIFEEYGPKALIDDYRTWRYYLNLNGEYHSTNEPMEILVLETNKLEPLTKELISKYKRTRIDLSKFSHTYKKLLAKYPNNDLLIKGILNPIDMEEAYKAKDGSILSYSMQYADVNDIAILQEVSRQLQRLYQRWYNHRFISMDSHQVAVFLAYLYSNLHSMIDLGRLKNLHTHKVHNYHLVCFFGSNLDINTKYMTRQSKLWLYQNLRAIKSNNGQNEVFKQIIDNVMTPNNIGIGKIVLKQSKPVGYEGVESIEEEHFGYESTDNILAESLNEHYDLAGITLGEIVAMEVSNGYIHETQYNSINELMDRVGTGIDSNNDLNVSTKVIHLSGKESRDNMPNPRISMILDNLFYIYTKANYDYDVVYTDPNTSTTYTLTMSKAIRLLFYYLLKLCDRDEDTATITSKSIFRSTDIDISSIMADAGEDGRYIKIVESYRPMISAVYNNAEELVEFINEAITFFIKEWEVKSSLINQVSIANLDLLNRYKNIDTFTITTNNIKEEIELIETDDYDYLDSIAALLLKISDDKIIIDVSSTMRDYLNTYVDLLTKTTSYNLQVLNTLEAAEISQTYDVWFGQFSGPVKVTADGIFNGLEPLDCDLVSINMPKVDDIVLQTGSYMLPTELCYDNGRAVDEYTTILQRFYLEDITQPNNNYIMAYSNDNHMLNTNLGFAQGGGVDETTLLRRVREENIDLDGNAYHGGGTITIKLKELKERM